MPTKITSKYTPFTYDEITKPLIQATQAQMAVEDAYTEVADKAAQALAVANQQTDPMAYKKLKAYADDLQSQADQLARYGLQRSTRQDLLNMRRRYANDVTPIDLAIKRRSELLEEQRKLRAHNPDLMFQRDMGSVSLDAMLENPNMDYGTPVNGADLANRAAATTKALGQAVASIQQGRQIDKYTKELLIKEGFTSEDIQAALAGDGSALGVALKRIYDNSGVAGWGNQAAADRAWGYIQQGAMLGSQAVKAQAVTDREALRREALADRAHEEAREDERLALQLGSKRAVNAETGSPFKDGELNWDSTKKCWVEGDGSNGKKYHKVRKDVYVEDVGEEVPSVEKESAKTQAWVNKNAGYIQCFDKDDDFGGTDYFYNLMADTDFLKNDGTFPSDRVTVMEVDNLYKLSNAEKQKAMEIIADSGLPYNKFVVLKVRRNGAIDDDVIVVHRDMLQAYKEEAIKRRGGTYSLPASTVASDTIPAVQTFDTEEGLNGGDIEMSHGEKVNAAQDAADAIFNLNMGFGPY